MSPRQAGRPSIGLPVTVRMGENLVELLDDWADDLGISRARLIRRVLSEAVSDHYRAERARREGASHA